MNVQLNDSGVPIIREKTLAQKIKGFLLWVILIILTLATALLVYLCVAGASEMNALTTFKQVSDHPYYTLDYDGYDYTDMLNKEPESNDEIVQQCKNKLFTKPIAMMLPGNAKTEKTVKGSTAFFAKTFIGTYMKGRIYNSYDTPIAMVVSTPQSGYKSWNIVDMADVGIKSGENVNQWYTNAFQTMAAAYCTSEGINQEGLSVSLISCPEAECKDTNKVNITPFMAVRLLLDRAATVQNAVDVLDDYDVIFSDGTYHLFVSEKIGNSAVIEYIDGEMSVTYMEHTRPGNSHQVCTNKLESSKASVKDFGDKYSENNLFSYFDNAFYSFEQGGGGMSQDYALVLMKKQSENYKEVDEEHYGTNRYGTQYIVFYDLDKMQMQIIIGNDTKNQSYTYDLTV